MTGRGPARAAAPPPRHRPRDPGHRVAVGTGCRSTAGGRCAARGIVCSSRTAGGLDAGRSLSAIRASRSGRSGSGRRSTSAVQPSAARATTGVVQRGAAAEQQQPALGIGDAELAGPVGVQLAASCRDPPPPRLGVVDRRRVTGRPGRRGEHRRGKRHVLLPSCLVSSRPRRRPASRMAQVAHPPMPGQVGTFGPASARDRCGTNGA